MFPQNISDQYTFDMPCFAGLAVHAFFFSTFFFLHLFRQTGQLGEKAEFAITTLLVQLLSPVPGGCNMVRGAGHVSVCARVFVCEQSAASFFPQHLSLS